MPVITGRQYIERIDKLKSNVWIDGERVIGNISEHPSFKGIIHSQAALYDLQYEAELKESMTYSSPLTKEFVGISFLQPKTKEDLAKRRTMIQQWAKLHHGLMGRSPDYMNTALTAFAASTDFLKGKKNCFSENLQAYYTYAREHDLSLTHTFIDPQVNRSKHYFEFEDEPVAARVIARTEEGIIVKGARLLATQGGFTDELLVLSSSGSDDEGNGFAFAIPSNTEGLKFICRESFVCGDSTFNYPLSSRYEEMDCIVVFDDVLIPWERVFYFDNLAVANDFLNESAFHSLSLHQVISRQIIKTEFLLGVVQSIIDSINIEEYQHVQEKACEIIVALEVMKSFVIRSEVEAELDEWGYMRPDIVTLRAANQYFTRTYPRFTEIVQLLGASGLMSIPTENTFNSEIRNDLDKYMQSKAHNAEDRVRLFRLAWDLTMSSFGTRQTLYERFFAGDPIRLSSYLYQIYDKGEYTERVNEFLQKKD